MGCVQGGKKIQARKINVENTANIVACSLDSFLYFSVRGVMVVELVTELLADKWQQYTSELSESY
jgi:hypothetical protein